MKTKILAGVAAKSPLSPAGAALAHKPSLSNAARGVTASGQFPSGGQHRLRAGDAPPCRREGDRDRRPGEWRLGPAPRRQVSRSDRAANPDVAFFMLNSAMGDDRPQIAAEAAFQRGLDHAGAGR